jgi:hypothetical protein
MRDIAHGFFAQSPALAGPVIALVLFFVVFVLIARRVMRTRDVDWTSDAALPLDGANESRTASTEGARS